ncbi:MAG: response regulator [Gemmatimonadales bacterium]
MLVATVLVVEDDSDVRNGLAKVLRRTGFTVATAENGRAALDQIERQSFQVVVSDIKMPVMDGMQLYERLRLAHPDAARRVLFVTAWGHESPIEQFLAGVDRPVLEKPFEMEEFVTAVRNLASQEPYYAPFSPDESARIRESIVTPGAPLACPRCGSQLHIGEPLAAGGSIAAPWELHCEFCMRSMIVRELPPGVSPE